MQEEVSWGAQLSTSCRSRRTELSAGGGPLHWPRPGRWEVPQGKWGAMLGQGCTGSVRGLSSPTKQAWVSTLIALSKESHQVTRLGTG